MHIARDDFRQSIFIVEHANRKHPECSFNIQPGKRRRSKMESPTVPPELKGAKGDIMAAKIEVPVLAVMIYGVVELVRLGWSQDHYLYTYAPVLGGVAASIGLFTYCFLISAERGRGRKNVLLMLGCLPYSYGSYVIGVLGLYTIFEGMIGKFSLLS